MKARPDFRAGTFRETPLDIQSERSTVMSDFLSLGHAVLSGENIPAAMVESFQRAQRCANRSIRKDQLGTGRRTARDTSSRRCLRVAGNSTGKDTSGSLRGLPVDELVWSLIVPSIGPESLKTGHFVLGPWGTLVVKAPLPK
jgi:hypothetical protein